MLKCHSAIIIRHCFKDPHIDRNSSKTPKKQSFYKRICFCINNEIKLLAHIRQEDLVFTMNEFLAVTLITIWIGRKNSGQGITLPAIFV